MSGSTPANDPVAKTVDGLPITLPITVGQYADLVRQGHFRVEEGQVELINGRIVRMNP